MSLACTFAVTLVVYRLDDEAARNAFIAEAQERLDVIRVGLERTVAVTDSTGSLLEANPALSREQFHTFASKLVGDSGPIEAVLWLPRVPLAERPHYEKRAQAEVAGYRFWELDERMQRHLAAVRQEYFPVLYAQVRNSASPVSLGFDMASTPERAAALRSAIDRGEITATPRIEGLRPGVPHNAIVLFRPVYRHGADRDDLAARRARAQGAVASVVYPELVLAEVLGHSAGQDLSVAIIDHAVSGTDGELASWPRFHNAANRASGMMYAANIKVGGRSWSLVVTPLSYPGLQAHWRAGAAFALGLAITALLAAYLSARERYAELVREQAIHDSLTGLYNRRYLDDVLAAQAESPGRRRAPFAAIMADVDRFKDVNDRFGHDAGDRVLKALGELLRNNVRDSDIACRIGGEEFVVLMPGATREAALERARDILAAVRELRPLEGTAGSGQLTVSLGVAVCGDESEDSAQLLKRADEALYEAKRGGRDRLVLAPPAPATASAGREAKSGDAGSAIPRFSS